MDTIWASDAPGELRSAFRHYLDEITARKGACEKRRAELTELSARLAGIETKIIATFGEDAVELNAVRARALEVAREVAEQNATITEGERILRDDVPQTQTLMEGVIAELESARLKQSSAIELQRELKELGLKAKSIVKASAVERARLDDLLGRYEHFADYLSDRRAKLDADREVELIRENLPADFGKIAAAPRQAEPVSSAVRRTANTVAGSG